jgi:hypothetical protein
MMFRAASLLLVLATLEARGGNQGLASGVYGASLGAGGGAGSERIAAGGNPAALRPGGTGVLLHFHRPFGLDELRVLEAGIYRDGVRAGLGACWRQTGAAELYLERTLEAAFAWRLGRKDGGFPGPLDIGGAWSFRSVEVAGREGAFAGRHGYGAVWRPIPRLAAGGFLRGLPLGRSHPGAAREQERIWQWGLEAAAGAPGRPEGRAVQILRFDMRKTGHADWRALASLALRPHPALEASAGLASAPFQLSLGVRLAWGGLEFHQAFRRHRDLGAGWLSSLGFVQGGD